MLIDSDGKYIEHEHTQLEITINCSLLTCISFINNYYVPISHNAILKVISHISKSVTVY